jgi:hypothetical protein
MIKDVIVLKVQRVTATVHDGSPIRRAAGTQQIGNAMFNAALQIRRLMGRQSSILVEPFSPLHHQCVAWILFG